MIADTLEKNENILVSGVWIGSAIHYLKDANIFSDTVKPYADLPGQHMMGIHQSIFAGNSLISFVFGTNGNKNP